LEQFKQGLTIFTREGYKVESVADVLQKSKEPFTWEQILIRDQRTQAAADLRKLSRKRNELAEKSVQGKGVIFVATKEVEKFPRALGRVLRALRDEKELSAEDVAGKLNILPDALLRFETGKMPLSKQRVEAVAAALDTSLGAVLDKLSVERGKSKDDITTEINEYFRASLPAASHADRYAINEEGNSPRRR
jgi:transcriptional regulator with XRE-family HTH domain